MSVRAWTPVLAGLALAAPVVAVASRVPVPTIAPVPAFAPESAARARGTADAEADLASGVPGILVVGRVRGFPGEIDPATGLPTRVHGCCADEAEREYVRAYNATMALAVESGRAAPFSFRDRVTTREAMRRAFAAADGSAAPFVRNSAPLAVPGGRHRVEARPWGEAGDRWDLAIVEVSSGHARVVAPMRAPVRVRFDAAGETLWVEDGDAHLTADVATGRVLQSFYDPPRDGGR